MFYIVDRSKKSGGRLLPRGRDAVRSSLGSANTSPEASVPPAGSG
jgi:hypothetical protein